MNINVAVTGLHATDNPAPGIGVVRCLKYPDGWNGQIIGLGYDVYDTGIYDEDLLDHTYLIPYPNQGADRALNRILYVHNQQRIDVLIPTLDSEVATYLKIKPELDKAGIATYLPTEQAIKRSVKSALYDFCQSNEIMTPDTVVIREPGQLEEVFERIGFPFFIKGQFYDAHKCTNREEATKHYKDLQRNWGLPMIAQKEITGQEFDICCVGGENGDVIGAVPIRKIGLTEKGKAWAAVTLRNRELLEFTREIFQKIGWCGPCELEIMQEDKTGNLILLEINPRFPAWVFLTAGAEQNLPRLVVDLAMGNSYEPLPPAKSGVTFVRHATDLICPLEYIESLTISGELHY